MLALVGRRHAAHHVAHHHHGRAVEAAPAQVGQQIAQAGDALGACAGRLARSITATGVSAGRAVSSPAWMRQRRR